MSITKTDLRQTIFRGTVPQLSTSTNPEGDNLINSLASDVTPLLRLNANTASLVVNVGASDILNSESTRRRAIAHIGKTYISFTSGTVTFPAASGGNVVSSPGGSTILTCPTGQFSAVLIYLDATSSLNTLAGPAAASATLAINSLPPAPTNTLAIGFVVVSNVGGVIQNIAQSDIRQFAAGTGSGGGGGTGSGIGDDLNALTFKASFSDSFDDLPSDPISAVDYTAGRTDSTTYDIVNGYHRLAYDSGKTVTGTGTAMTISATPAFTIKVGDVLVVGAQARRITVVTTQTSITIESAFTVNPSAAACTLSQAVYTKDLNNFSVDGLPISNVYTTTINQILATYDDTETVNDIILDNGVTPNIAFTASSNNSDFSSVSLRPVQLSSESTMVDLPTAGTSLFLRFFANRTSGSGTVNILGYKVFFHKDAAFADGSILNQAYAFTNGVGAEINCLAPSVVSGKTRLQTTFTFPVGVNSGTPNGSIKVYLNGQKLPRFIDATLTPDGSYREIDERTIELDTDYSASQLSLEVIQDVAVVDNLDVNSTNISQAQEATGEGFQAFIQSSRKMNPTTATGTPAAGTFYSTVINRKAMQDFNSDLGVRLGIERIFTAKIYQLQDEFGPNGESVFSAVNESLDRIRFVGSWDNKNIVDSSGQRQNTSVVGNYVEITFYGTGLNLITAVVNDTRDARASVDGGAEGSNLFPGSLGSIVTAARNVNPNNIINAASGLALGVHTVRVRNASGSLDVYGFEILNQAAALTVQPGSAFINNKKITLNSQQAISFNSGFESGILGTRGGRVSAYIKPDGTIAKAVRPVDAVQLNLTAADHTNEEVARSYYWREFGANRADDFSTLSGTVQTGRIFTLDDASTTLAVSTTGVYVFSGTPQGLTQDAVNSNFVFTFVGTGLDIEKFDVGSGTIDANTVFIDGVSIGSFTGTVASGASSLRRIKIVSGLPYGTHTLRINRTAYSVGFYAITNLIVYQPKKPAIPSGAVELADYNLMADYSVSAAAGLDRNSSGVLAKASLRDFVYVNGTGGGQSWAATFGVQNRNGFTFDTDRSGAYAECVFFGTGFDFRVATDASLPGASTLSLNGLTLNSTNFPSVTHTNVGVAGFTFATGIMTQNAATSQGNILSFRGLPLGLYRFRQTANSAAFIQLNGIDVITPIHAAKVNSPFVNQNVLTIGSNSLADVRKLTPVKEANAQTKNISQAFGVQSQPTITSAALVPLPDMSLTHDCKTGRIEVTYSGIFGNSAAANSISVVVLVNGLQFFPVKTVSSPVGTFVFQISDSLVFNVPIGVNKIDLLWSTTAGTATAYLTQRNLLVKDV